MTLSQREKRAARRVSVALTAHCRIGNRFVREPVADLSSGGLYLKSHAPAQEGIAVRVALALPYDDGPRFCTLAGSVVRLDKDPAGRLCGLAVSFLSTEMSDADRVTLETFLSTRSA